MKLRKKRRTAEAVTSLLPYFSWLCERKAYKSKAIVASKRRTFNLKKQNPKVSEISDNRSNSDTMQIVTSLVTSNVTCVTTRVSAKRDENDLSTSFNLSSSGFDELLKICDTPDMLLF